MTEIKKGKVLFFDPKKNFGYIQIDGIDKEVYYNSSSVDGDALILLKDEIVNVEFELSSGTSSAAVKKIVRDEKRFTGEILNYENGTGVLFCFQDNKEYPVYFKDFVFSDRTPIYEKSRVHIEAGDEVEFSLKDTEGFGTKAILIISDGKKPIEKFASLGNFDSHLAELAKLSPEPWDYMNSDSGAFCLY